MIFSFTRGTPEKGWVVVVHGLGEHIGRYETLINGIVKRGYGVIGFDLPGHGKSSGKRGHTSVEEVIDVINELTSDLDKFHIFGHSLGGLISIRYTQENANRIKSLVVSSPALHVKARFSQKLLLAIFGIFYPALTLSNGISPDDLSRNRKVVENYIEDELVHDRISVKLARSILKNVAIAHEKVGLISVPTMMLIGTGDVVTPPQGSYLFFNNLQLMKENKKLYRFEGAYHEIFEDDEFANEFFGKIFEWYEMR
ncbi:lysophospholipase [Thermosipho melanesiensis]|uniref:Alpha/beta hydrolase fold n=2 Tax=Thermosipho melanesiensis TaxID=46541 RepID=A6LJM1_THEM4|nr:alpha/beta hydrolase [Thermosipho melanesiensis]ABR30122.1 alpha/beta hydrolase fold [Thermosipho melanesiensis BI429]APT73319.1 lysophospholipase [Thermosipho melanesiensis]OOC38709.1 lysophospholipase [Thermosipho melanesiensis]OOC40513.1 lysophospholipase [Thermosipho melanesiensis]OOC40778.1 lysophospholipase [Thermosipho melanesiensis]